MPAPNQLNPDSLRTKLRVHLASHPGWHDTGSIADALGVPRGPDRTALVRELNRLAAGSDGVTSYRDPSLPSRGPGTKYARHGTPAPQTTTTP